jgi:hypothetical protein
MSAVGVGSAADSPREYFRAFLQQHAPRLSDLAWYFDQSLPRFGGDAEVRLAVEELVDHVGRLLGFTTSRREEDDHSTWSSPAGSHLLVWAVDQATAISRVGQCGRAKDAALAILSVPTADRVTALLVVCGPAPARLLDDAVVLRRTANQVRAVSVASLRTLASLVENQRISHDDALLLLKPASALADPLIALLESF